MVRRPTVYALKVIQFLHGQVQLARPDHPRSEKVTSVAICAGSGGSMLLGVDADVYLTGEMSHVSKVPFGPTRFKLTALLRSTRCWQLWQAVDT